MYAVTVLFRIHPDQIDSFMPLMLKNARTSLRDEPGCFMFDVCRGEPPEEVFLYELYENRAAFEAHLASTHFKSFDAAVAGMVAGKEIRTYGEVHR